MDKRQERISCLCDQVREDNWTLRTLGVLLTGEEYLEFLRGDIDGHGWEYRRGLRETLNLCIENQEQRIAEIELENAGLGYYIEQANAVCADIILGKAGRHTALEIIDQRLKGLFAAISEYGLPTGNGGGQGVAARWDLVDLKAVIKKATDQEWREKYLSDEVLQEKAIAYLNKQGPPVRIVEKGTAVETQEAHNHAHKGTNVPLDRLCQALEELQGRVRGLDQRVRAAFLNSNGPAKGIDPEPEEGCPFH
jgi:hypothetical protein